MENVIELHKQDLAAGKKKLKTLTPQSNEWWECKDKVKKFEIAYSQAANLAIQVSTSGQSELGECELWLHYYELLTAPYRSHRDEFRDGSKKVKHDKTLVNIDEEINL